MRTKILATGAGLIGHHLAKVKMCPRSETAISPALNSERVERWKHARILCYNILEGFRSWFDLKDSAL